MSTGSADARHATALWVAAIGRVISDPAASAELITMIGGLAEMLPDAFWMLAGDGHMVYANQAFQRIWGLTREQVATDPSLILNSVHPDDRPAIVQISQQAASAQVIYPDYRVLRPDGELRWVHTRTIAQRSAAGDLQLLVGIAEDITERKLAELRLHESQGRLRDSEAQYRLLVEHQDQLVVKVDPQGRFLYVSPSYLALFGKTEEELLGKAFMPLVHEEDLPATLAAMANLRSPPYRAAMEQRAMTRFGWRWLQWLDTAIIDDQGQIQAIIGIGRDITELRKAREDLRRAKEDAERANRAKDDFLAMLSHELRTPLTPVLATVSLLQGDPAVPPPIREDLLMVRRNIELEARLIDDLLDLTRISRGKLRLEAHHVDAHELLKQALSISQADIALKEIQVSLALQAEQSTLLADPARIQQVFWNILKNAVHFTSAGGAIEITTRNQGQSILVAIHDNGVGIAPEFLPRIFGAFEQEGGRSSRQGGLGLGMAISRTIIDLHGGEISAESQGPGTGSTFTVMLPLAEVQKPVSREPPAAMVAVPGTHTVPLRILLVEDHASTLGILSRLLRKNGHSVTPAMSLAQARQVAPNQRFDLLISDIGLPDGSGVDLMCELRTRPDLRAIALTGFGMDNDLAASHAAGFDAHLTKPVDVETLNETIDEVMARPRPLRDEEGHSGRTGPI